LFYTLCIFRDTFPEAAFSAPIKMFSLRSLSLVLSALRLSTTYAIPTSSNDDLLKRQAPSAPYPVNGVRNGEINPRYELRDLQNQHPEQFNVFLLGLKRLQAADQNDMLSYFQVAGRWKPLAETQLSNSYKVFTECPWSTGMVSQENRNRILATALTLPTYFFHGTGHTWLYSR